MRNTALMERTQRVGEAEEHVKPRSGYVVLHKVTEDTWRLVGEADRRPGLTARRARAQAINDAVGHEPEAGETYAAVPRSEWRVGLDW
jgi:hypothetical protein